MRRIKAQASIEFMNIFIVLFIVVSIFSAMFIKAYSDIQTENARMLARNTASVVSEEINKAWVSGSGFSTTLILPEEIAGQDYDININSSAHILELNTSEGFVAFSSIIPENVEVIQWEKGKNQSIENVNGKVVIK